MIKDNLLEGVPTWYKNIDKNKNYLVLTNDLDSYYSCKTLNELFEIEIGGFYDFKSGLWLNNEITKDKEPIYVDLAITEGKTFDNHMNFIKNPEAINPNIITTQYYKKYNGSTLAFICALYDIDLSKKTQTNLTTLLTIDGWYQGYYNCNGKYKSVNEYWLEELGITKYLLPILQEHDKNYFENFKRLHNIDAEIIIDNGILKSSDKLYQLSNLYFDLVLPVKNIKAKTYELKNYELSKIVTDAQCYKDSFMLNIRK